MAVDLAALKPEFRSRVRTLLEACGARDVEMRPYGAIRSPFQQARLWRQSRAREEILAQIKAFREAGAPFLAHCLASVGPQYGKHVTNALPGFSWHQWAEAVDCFWVVDGKAEWSTTRAVGGVNGYRVYAEEAERLDLTAGGLWTSFRDWPHVQARPDAHPGAAYSLSRIDAEMKRRFEA